MMYEIGIYSTEDGKRYDCRFNPEIKHAKAIGPLPEQDGVFVARNVVCQVSAKTREQAREKLAQGIGPGSWLAM